MVASGSRTPKTFSGGDQTPERTIRSTSLGSENEPPPRTSTPSSAREALKRKSIASPHHDFKASPGAGKKETPKAKKLKKDFREAERLHIALNVYDLVWDKEKKGNNAGLVDIGLGFYHTGLELWGKELSFGHSKRFKSGVFAVRPKRADELMPHTVFRETIDIDTIKISRYSVDKILNRLSAKYTSDAYNVVRNNCNHFTDELCLALCGKSIPDWINRPAKMGSSVLDGIQAPFEAVNNIIAALTPSKKANHAPSSEAPGSAKTPRSRTVAPLATARQLSMGEIPESAQEVAKGQGGVPMLASPEAGRRGA